MKSYLPWGPRGQPKEDRRPVRLRGSVIRDNVIDAEGQPVVSRDGTDNLIEHNRGPVND